MLDRVTLPVKVALTGPTLAWTVAVISVSDTFSSDWQPGMVALRIAGSLSAAQTFSRGAGIRYSPDISMGYLIPKKALSALVLWWLRRVCLPRGVASRRPLFADLGSIPVSDM